MDQLAGLTEEARKLALDRFHLLRPHLEDDRPLKLVAAEAEIPFRTAQRWVALYRKFGLAALARKNRADRGERRAVSSKIKEAIEGLALQKPPLPTTAICNPYSPGPMSGKTSSYVRDAIFLLSNGIRSRVAPPETCSTPPVTVRNSRESF